MENIREEIAKWSSKFALFLATEPETDKLEWALNGNLNTHELSLDELGQLMFILSSHHSTLAAEMGRVYARMRYDSSDSVSRVKLNIIKPQHDALDLKITVIKKLFDRKVYAHKRMNTNA